MLNNIIDKILKFRNPIKYWRRKGVVIGNNCEIYASVSFGSEPYLVTLGDHVRVGAECKFFTHDGGVWVLRGLYEELRDIDKFGKIVIGNNVHIGIGCMILPNVTIGNNCIIGAGAIVTKNVPDNSVVAGVPARVIKTIDDYKEKNLETFEHTKGMKPKQKRKYLIKKYADKNL